MSEEPISGEVVHAPAADIRYEDEDAQRVVNVIIRVERADGSVKEYEAREPQDFQMNDPESFSAQVFRQTGLGLASGSDFRGVTAGVPSLRLSFSAHPRYNLHIRNVRRPGGEPGPSQSSIPSSSTSSPAVTGKGS